jgi:hypothetical protein
MTRSLPSELIEVFAGSITTELVIVDDRGQPLAWPATPSYHAAEGCIDVAVDPSHHERAGHASRDPHVALLFSDPAGTGLETPPMVLVQGTASVRVEIRVRPERVYVWPRANLEAEPRLYDARVEEVRSAHNEEPEVGHAAPEGGSPAWDPRLDALGVAQATAVLAFVGPDGFPFAVRVPVQAEREERVVRIDSDPVGAPIEPGLACLCAHVHAPDLAWRRSLEVLGDLDEDRGGWVLRPHGVLGDLAPTRGTSSR